MGIRVRGLRPELQFARLGIKKGYRLHRYEDLILGEENRKQIKETMITGKACQLEFETDIEVNVSVGNGSVVFSENWEWMKGYMQGVQVEAYANKKKAAEERKELTENITEILKEFEGRKRVYRFLANAHTYKIKFDEAITKALFSFYSEGGEALNFEQVKQFMSESMKALVELALEKNEANELKKLLKDENPLAVRRRPNIVKRIVEIEKNLNNLRKLSEEGYKEETVRLLVQHFASYEAFSTSLPSDIFPEETKEAKNLTERLERFAQLLMLDKPPEEWIRTSV